MPRTHKAAPPRRAVAGTASRVPGDRRWPEPKSPRARADAASHLAHQALRPEPEEAEEQGIHDHVLVDSADQIGRQGLDDTDRKSGHERAGHTAETTQRHRDEGYDPQRFADGRHDIKESRN